MWLSPEIKAEVTQSGALTVGEAWTLRGDVPDKDEQLQE